MQLTLQRDKRLTATMDGRPEGGDITAEDMLLPEEPPSEIGEFFEDSTIFLTGATGYLGKLLLEKLLRGCPKLKHVYILIREKKGKECEKRFQEVFDVPIFDGLKRKGPNFQSKVSMVAGDCVLPDLGLDEETKGKLIDEVDVVFHCAATVRFDQHLKTATYINVRAVRDLVGMAKQMKKLRAFVHVSTAFSHCPRKDIEERFYEPRVSGEKLLTLVDCLNDDVLKEITPQLLGEWPNTYAFSKASAEEFIQNNSNGLPITIVRPSIVIATVKEPVAGFIDNIYGPVGVLLGAAMGVMRTLYGDENLIADIVPADYVINTIIAAAWHVGTTKIHNDERAAMQRAPKEDIPIFNYVSSTQNPIKWKDYISLAEKHAPAVPSPHIIWHCCFAMRSNKHWNAICLFFLHFLPAYVVDGIFILIGKKPMVVDGYKKIDKFGAVISYFAMREWNFRNDNTQALWRKLSRTDKELFEFDMSLVDWDAYYYTYVRGGRVYLMKDPLDTIPQGAAKRKKLIIAHYTVIFLFWLMVVVFLRLFLRLIF